MIERPTWHVETDCRNRLHVWLLRILANDGHDTRGCRPTLGQKNIQRTLRYTELSPTRFKDFWRDTASGEGIWARSEDSGTFFEHCRE